MKKILLRMLRKLKADPVPNKDEIAEITAELAELEALEVEEEEAKKEKKEPSELEKQIEALKAEAKKADEDKLALLEKLKESSETKGDDPIAKAIKAEEKRLEELKEKEKELELQRVLDGLKADQATMLEKLANAEKENKLLENKNEITALKASKPHLAELLDKITLDGEGVTSESIASELAFVFKFNDEEKLKADYEAKKSGKNPFATETEMEKSKKEKTEKGDKKIPKEIAGDKLDENIDLVAQKIADDPNFLNKMYMEFE